VRPIYKRLSEEEFIAFDIETTGLHPAMARIVEIGAVRFKGDGSVLDSFQQLIDPS
jgi:DNA polymerase III alpha subunit (gram-positive type)